MRAKALSPAIIKIAPDQRAFSEEWIPGNKVVFSIETLVEVIGKMKKHVYVVEHFDAFEFRRSISEWNISLSQWDPLLENMLAEWPGRSLPMSQVHGDLVAANLWHNPARGIVLLDWEYSRRCLVTQDCWFYIYHHYRFQDKQVPLSKAFFNEFHDVLMQSGFGYLAERVQVIHGLHLVERLIFLKAMTPFAHHSIRTLESDLHELSRKRLEAPRNST